jgi:hypothetical protein
VRAVAPGLFTTGNNAAAAYAVRIEANRGLTVLAPCESIVLDDQQVYQYHGRSEIPPMAGKLGILKTTLPPRRRCEVRPDVSTGWPKITIRPRYPSLWCWEDLAAGVLAKLF